MGELASSVAPDWREREDGRDYRAASMVWLGQDASPRLMVDVRLNILWRNDVGDELLAERHEIESINGFLRATNPAAQSDLALFVENASADLSTWQVARKDGRGFLLLRAMRLDDETVGLTAVRTGAEYMQRFADLDRAFKLTTSEHRVLTGLLAGEEADKLARLHGVSVETTRTHIRNVYAKMGVNSRERLFACALPFRL